MDISETLDRMHMRLIFEFNKIILIPKSFVMPFKMYLLLHKLCRSKLNASARKCFKLYLNPFKMHK